MIPSELPVGLKILHLVLRNRDTQREAKHLALPKRTMTVFALGFFVFRKSSYEIVVGIDYAGKAQVRPSLLQKR